ncbi:MAG: serine hydrolase [Gemmatimonadaceae bacterium]
MLTILATAMLLTAPVAQHTDSLRARVEARIARVPGAIVGVSYLDLASGDSLHVNADTSFHAASTMKVPVMIEFFRQADRGERSLDERMLLVNEFTSIVDGSPYSLTEGDDSDSLVYRRVGQRVPVLELLERMIIRSSNLATNALIETVDARKANATARELGARSMKVLRGVEDLKAYERGLNNTTTSRDLAALLRAIEQGRAASPANTRAMRDILLRQEHNGEIPAGLPAGTRVAHKTGFITAILHDAAIVYPEGGTPYVLVVLTGGIRDRDVARELIRDLSRIVYERRHH